jgi:hypothetical protein
MTFCSCQAYIFIVISVALAAGAHRRLKKLISVRFDTRFRWSVRLSVLFCIDEAMDDDASWLMGAPLVSASPASMKKRTMALREQQQV